MVWRKRPERSDAPRAQWSGERLFLLVGHPRSGTTFLGRLLGSHPDVGYWEEPGLLDFASRTHQELRRLHRHLEVDAHVDASTLREGASSRKQHPPNEAEERVADARALTRTRELVGRLVDDFRDRSGRPIVLEKTPAGIRLVDRVGDLLPAAKVVHIVRDPRDLAASVTVIAERRGRPAWIPEQGEPVDVVPAQWVSYLDRWFAAEAAIGSGTLHLIRHEDLVADPRPHLDRLLAFLGLAWVPAFDEFLRSGHSGGLDPARSGLWPERLTADEVARVEAVAGPTMARLGYATRS